MDPSIWALTVGVFIIVIIVFGPFYLLKAIIKWILIIAAFLVVGYFLLELFVYVYEKHPKLACIVFGLILMIMLIVVIYDDSHRYYPSPAHIAIIQNYT
ncbi:hypothetical protein [Ruminococcus sp.]|uniref:hypothetical protein n=1 Tax=Ruminococcus sp. TaxID=41978 RepID=UPI0038637C41